MKLKIKLLSENAIVPEYKTEGASGFDFHALEDISISAGQTKLIKTGLSFEIPKGYELQVRPRSGLSLNTKLRVSNSPGTVDHDFRGEVCIIMDNISGAESVFSTIKIKKGDRIAQGVICPVVRAEFDVVNDLSETKRGSGGFGSTN